MAVSRVSGWVAVSFAFSIREWMAPPTMGEGVAEKMLKNCLGHEPCIHLFRLRNVRFQATANPP
jgi:hypothetical protein